MQRSEDGGSAQFPAYFMKGQRIEVDGKEYVIPESVACKTIEDLVIYLYRRRVQPFEYSTAPG